MLRRVQLSAVIFLIMETCKWACETRVEGHWNKGAQCSHKNQFGPRGAAGTRPIPSRPHSSVVSRKRNRAVFVLRGDPSPSRFDLLAAAAPCPPDGDALLIFLSFCRHIPSASQSAHSSVALSSQFNPGTADGLKNYSGRQYLGKERLDLYYLGLLIKLIKIKWNSS